MQIRDIVVSINAINSNYSYFQKYQYKFFGETIPAEKFEFLMRKYGIKSSGDRYKDINALYQAMYSEANVEVIGNIASVQQESQAIDAGNSTNIPWANLMSRIGLTATGDLAIDYERFNAKISAMQSSAAASQQQKALINELLAEAKIVFVQKSLITQNSKHSQQITGADIQAQLNRLYFFS